MINDNIQASASSWCGGEAAKCFIRATSDRFSICVRLSSVELRQIAQNHSMEVSQLIIHSLSTEHFGLCRRHAPSDSLGGVAAAAKRSYYCVRDIDFSPSCWQELEREIWKQSTQMSCHMRMWGATTENHNLQKRANSSREREASEVAVWLTPICQQQNWNSPSWSKHWEKSDYSASIVDSSMSPIYMWETSRAARTFP